MNKTVILIQLIISSSLPNPIDVIIISKDVVDFKITDPETILKIDEGNTVQLNVDDKVYSVLRRLKGLEELEDTTTFTTTTTNFEINGISGDDLEDSTDSPIEFNLSKNTEEEFESNIPNDEYNSEWDLFDDTISTRRMMNNFEELSEEIRETTNTDSNPNVSEDKYHQVSGVEEKQRNETDDYLENIQNQNIIERISHKTPAIKKEKENKNKHLEIIQNYNVEGDNTRRASDISKEEKQHLKRMRISNLDRIRNFDTKYGSKSTEVPGIPAIQRIPCNYRSPLKIPRYNKPAIPMYIFNSENFNNYKINRIPPVTRIRDFEGYSFKPYNRKRVPAVLVQKSIRTNIISKLAEATENSYKFAAGNELYFNNKKPFTSFHNFNKYMYVPKLLVKSK